jgi:acetyl/propionyl-CoA carboxylase alpha subunit
MAARHGRDEAGAWAELDGRRHRLQAWRHGSTLTVVVDGARHRLGLADDMVAAAGEVAGDGTVRAPLPGRIAGVLVAEGDTVAAGQKLVVLEAMKMEHALAAPTAGRVVGLRATVGEQVDAGALLVEIGAAP